MRTDELVATAVRGVGGHGQALEEVVAELDRRSVLPASVVVAPQRREQVVQPADVRPTGPLVPRRPHVGELVRERRQDLSSRAANVSCLWRPAASSV